MGSVDGWTGFGLGCSRISRHAEQCRCSDSVSRGRLLSVFDKAQLNALGDPFIRLHGQGIFMNELFWGLWLFPSDCWYLRSGFLPRFIGGWLMVNCFGYVALCLIALLAPDYYEAVFKWAQPVLFGELAIMLWLLIKAPRCQLLQARFNRRRVVLPFVR